MKNSPAQPELKHFPWDFLKEFLPGHQNSSLHKLTANKTRQEVKKKPTKNPIIQLFSPIVSILEIFQMVTYYLRTCQESSRKRHTLLWVTTAFLTFYALNSSAWADLLHFCIFLIKLVPNSRYFTALTWQGQEGGKQLGHRMGVKKKTSHGFEWLNSTLQNCTLFLWEQTRSSQPQNPQKELKSKEVRAAEIK